MQAVAHPKRERSRPTTRAVANKNATARIFIDERQRSISRTARTSISLTYNFYDQLGQLVATIPPEGVKKLLGGGINNYGTKQSIPFITLFTYNQKGQLLGSWNADEGKSEFVYRRDGSIRFSQNAVQRAAGRYSYTDYDRLGRATESGEYEPLSGGIPFNADLTQNSPMKSILENTAPGGGLANGNRYDVVRTYYDSYDNSHNQPGYLLTDVGGGKKSYGRKICAAGVL